MRVCFCVRPRSPQCHCRKIASVPRAPSVPIEFSISRESKNSQLPASEAFTASLFTYTGPNKNRRLFTEVFVFAPFCEGWTPSIFLSWKREFHCAGQCGRGPGQTGSARVSFCSCSIGGRGERSPEGTRGVLANPVLLSGTSGVFSGGH